MPASACWVLGLKTFTFRKETSYYFYEYGLGFLCLYTICLQSPQKLEASITSSKTGVTDGCVIPCGCSESDLSLLLEEQPVLVTTEPSLQPVAFKTNKHPLILCYAYTCVPYHERMEVGKQLWEVSFLLPSANFRDQTLVVRLGVKCRYPLSYLAGPSLLIFTGTGYLN